MTWQIAVSEALRIVHCENSPHFSRVVYATLLLVGWRAVGMATTPVGVWYWTSIGFCGLVRLTVASPTSPSDPSIRSPMRSCVARVTARWRLSRWSLALLLSRVTRWQPSGSTVRSWGSIPPRFRWSNKRVPNRLGHDWNEIANLMGGSMRTKFRLRTFAS